MSTPSDLTTLASVQGWLGVNTLDPPQQATLNRLITAVSTVVLNQLGRPPFFLQSFSEVRDGPGSDIMLLRHWPVVAVTSLTIDGVVVPLATSPATPGYLWETHIAGTPGHPQTLALVGYRFTQNRQNVVVGYQAGYCIQGEAAVVPNASPYKVSVAVPYGPWAVDGGVTLGGVAMTKVAANPAAGQYTANPATPGDYVFAAANANANVLISYSYVPSAIESAVMEQVAERYRYKDRIGHTSKSLGGQETTAFSLKDMQDYVKMAIQPYRRVIPV